MRYFLTPFLCLLPALLAGCPSAPPVAEAEPIPELTVVHSAHLLSGAVDFFALSEDGNTFVAGSLYDGVSLCRASDYALLERYYPQDKEDLSWEERIEKPRAHIYGVGYIDANTWYFTGDFGTRGENYFFLHVKSIDPAREILELDVGMADGAAAFPANKDYILQGNWLVDWRTGKHYPFDAPSDPLYTIIPTLTPDNRVITHIDTREYDGTVIIDPIHGTTEYWKEAAAVSVTSDNRHAIGMSTKNYKCTLWRWPERKEIGHCSKRLHGIFGGLKYSVAWEPSPDGKFFAVSVDNSVQVYRIEPFQLELEATTPGQVVALALSDDGWLATYDDKGSLRAWNVATGSLAGQYDFPGGVGWEGANGYKLLFQPNSNKLFVKRSSVTVFEIPKQTARPEAGGDPGTRKE